MAKRWCSDRLAGRLVTPPEYPDRALLAESRRVEAALSCGDELIGSGVLAQVKTSCHLLSLLSDRSQPQGMQPHVFHRPPVTVNGLFLSVSVSSTQRRVVARWINE